MDQDSSEKLANGNKEQKPNIDKSATAKDQDFNGCSIVTPTTPTTKTEANEFRESELVGTQNNTQTQGSGEMNIRPEDEKSCKEEEIEIKKPEKSKRERSKKVARKKKKEKSEDRNTTNEVTAQVPDDEPIAKKLSGSEERVRKTRQKRSVRREDRPRDEKVDEEKKKRKEKDKEKDGSRRKSNTDAAHASSPGKRSIYKMPPTDKEQQIKSDNGSTRTAKKRKPSLDKVTKAPVLQNVAKTRAKNSRSNDRLIRRINSNPGRQIVEQPQQPVQVAQPPPKGPETPRRNSEDKQGLLRQIYAHFRRKISSNKQVKEGDDTMIRKDDSKQPEYQGEYASEDLPQGENLMKTNENNGQLFVRGVPFWLIQDEKPPPRTSSTLISEAILELKNQKWTLLDRLESPATIDPYAELEFLKKRDMEYFNSDKRVLSNTLRSSILIKENAEKYTNQENRSFVKKLSFKMPAKALVYNKRNRHIRPTLVPFTAAKCLKRIPPVQVAKSTSPSPVQESSNSTKSPS